MMFQNQSVGSTSILVWINKCPNWSESEVPNSRSSSNIAIVGEKVEIFTGFSLTERPETRQANW